MTLRSIAGWRTAILAWLGVWLVGCTSSLHIDVAVYKGPVSGSTEARIDRALGLARTNLMVAGQIKAKKPWHKWYDKTPEFEQLLADIEQHYFDLGFQEPGTKSLGLADDQLAARLRTYAQHCQAIVRRIGFAEIEKANGGFGLAILFVDVDYLAALVDIDENSRLIDALAAVDLKPPHPTGAVAAEPNKDQEVFLANINHIISSQAPGALMLAVRETVPFWYRAKIDRIYNGVYWGEINPIEASGTGDYVAMLVKDDVGNWHLKKVEVDPEEIIKTAAKLAELALKIGLPAP